MADNIRSIPSIADGLNSGQRKVIWTCFKRKIKKEIKVYYLLNGSIPLVNSPQRPLNLPDTFLSMQPITTAKLISEKLSSTSRRISRGVTTCRCYARQVSLGRVSTEARTGHHLSTSSRTLHPFLGSFSTRRTMHCSRPRKKTIR